MYDTTSRAMKVSKSPVVTELEYIEPLCTVFESGSTTIISCTPLGEGAFDGLRHVDFLRPLFRADRIPVQRVDDRIASRAILVVARREKDDNVPVDGIAFEIAVERLPVNLDALDDRRSRPGHDVRHIRLDLTKSGKRAAGGRQAQRQNSGAPFQDR